MFGPGYLLSWDLVTWLADNRPNFKQFMTHMAEDKCSLPLIILPSPMSLRLLSFFPPQPPILVPPTFPDPKPPYSIFHTLISLRFGFLPIVCPPFHSLTSGISEMIKWGGLADSTWLEMDEYEYTDYPDSGALWAMPLNREKGILVHRLKDLKWLAKTIGCFTGSGGCGK